MVRIFGVHFCYTNTINESERFKVRERERQRKGLRGGRRDVGGERGRKRGRNERLKYREKEKGTKHKRPLQINI